MWKKTAAYLILILALGVTIVSVKSANSVVPFGISWTNGWQAKTQIQYATTPTSTWKTLCIASVGDNVCFVDNNTMTRGRYYYFRMRHIADNGAALTPWSKQIGAVWLTGNVPAGGNFLIPKDNSLNILFIPGGNP